MQNRFTNLNKHLYRDYQKCKSRFYKVGTVELSSATVSVSVGTAFLNAFRRPMKKLKPTRTCAERAYRVLRGILSVTT